MSGTNHDPQSSSSTTDIPTTNTPTTNKPTTNTPTTDMDPLRPIELTQAWHVDQAIVTEGKRVVVIRFGRNDDTKCIRQDKILRSIAPRVEKFAVIYRCDTSKVKDFNQMYELYDRCTMMFFWRNKHMMVDLGTGDNNKINWVIKNKQELIDIIEVVYRGARKGRGLVVAPKDYSTRHRY